MPPVAGIIRRMKTSLLPILAAVGILSATLIAGDYKADFAKLKKDVPKEKMEKHLAAWRKREPQNPGAWIMSSNWTMERADGVEMRGKNGEKLPEGKYNMEERDGRVLILGKDGGVVGEMVSSTNPDGVRKAAAFLAEALKKWPHRGDIHCGLATIYGRDGFWKEHVEAVEGFAKAARANPGKMRWCHDEAPAQKEEEFIAGTLHDFAIRQYEKETPEGDGRFLAIAKLIVETCPKSAKGYNDLAIGYSLGKNWEAAQPVLEKGVEVVPDDSILWMNLGENSVKAGKKDVARKAFKHVIEMKPAKEMMEDAKGKLEKLEKEGA